MRCGIQSVIMRLAMFGSAVAGKMVMEVGKDVQEYASHSFLRDCLESQF